MAFGSDLTSKNPNLVALLMSSTVIRALQARFDWFLPLWPGIPDPGGGGTVLAWIGVSLLPEPRQGPELLAEGFSRTAP